MNNIIPPPETIFTENEIKKLEALKSKWTFEQIKKEAYGDFKPTGSFLAQLKYQRWRYTQKLLNDGK